MFRLGTGNFLMVLAARPAQSSRKRLRRHVGKARLTLASPTEVFEVAGYRIGTVAPFGLRQPLRILVDRGVLGEVQVSIGSGEAYTGIVLGSEDLMRALRAAELVDVAHQD